MKVEIPDSAGNGTDYELIDGVLSVNSGFTGSITAEYTFTTSPTREIDFEYDHNGLRTQKKVVENGITTIYDYTLHGKLITHLTKRTVNEEGVETSEELHFFYDAQSRPAFVEYEGEMYRYIHNLQCDIVGILDNSGALVVEYKYDAWGKHVIIVGNATSIVSKLNPFRYRGYQYDDEHESYYLENRYYNPTMNRFFNADRLVHLEKPGPLVNVFQYGYNSPIVNLDVDGNDVESLNGLTGILVFLKDDYDCAISIAEGIDDPIRFLGHTAAIYNGIVYSYGPTDGNVLDTDAIVTIMYNSTEVKEYMRTHEYQYCYYMSIDIPDDIDITKALSNVTALRGNRASSASTYSTYYVNDTADSMLSRYSPLSSNCVEFVKYCYSQFNVDLTKIFAGPAYLPRLLVGQRINDFERVTLPK